MNEVTISRLNDVEIYEHFCTTIALCESRAECKDISDKAKALEELAKRIKNTDAERRAFNVRIIAERRYGELLKELARAETSKGGDVKSASARGTPIQKSPYAEAIQKDGISRQQANRYESLATVPQEVFDDALRSVDKPSARKLVESIREPQPQMPIKSLRFWGALREFERDGFLEMSVAELMEPMTEGMQEDVKRLIPLMTDYFTFERDQL